MTAPVKSAGGGHGRGFTGGVARLGRSGAALAICALAACAGSPILPGASETAAVATTGSIAPASARSGDDLARGAFSTFVAQLWPEAQARGVSRTTFDAAFAGVAPDPKIIALTRRQAEFVRPAGDYLAKAVTAVRLERGGQVAGEYASTLNAIAATYGVDRAAIIGVWGMETNFGTNFGKNYVIRSLATLAYERYRGDYFKRELLVALQILQEGHIAVADMQGSWAGAMGQTQFMPTSFMAYAVDYDHDGRRDIWRSVPDALASTANYLKKHGWVTGLPWGFEVVLPPGPMAEGTKHSFAAWAAAGARRADGKAFPAHGEASVLRPAGAGGPAFLVTRNFFVIKRYNNATSYALGVAHLGDRIYGGAPIQAAWPTAPVTTGSIR